jgi:hypothetical protein
MGELVTNSIDRIQEVPDEEHETQDSGTTPTQTLAEKPEEITTWSGRLPSGEAVINLL